MGRLDGRVVIITGAGRGLGRAHALYLAAEGAHVVVNDYGGGVHGEGGGDATPAEQVVAEIEAAGGKAVASPHDVSDWAQAAEMVELAVETFGALHVLVNNAGILRDRTLANMSEDEWDAVIGVHLKGHAAPTRHALAYWRRLAKEGTPLDASVVMTTSISGLLGNFGQANYASAKLGVCALSRVVALEGASIGVRSNAVSPGARTRISMDIPGAEFPEIPEGEFDPNDPMNVSPLIAWLSERDCPANSQIFHLSGRQLLVYQMPPVVHDIRSEGRFTLEDLDRELTPRLVPPVDVNEFIAGLVE
ncbi:MAG TPA: SDR family NAD(P)-dependent oxidoreductase [Acidimicrobiales bacterium]|nr:SDR family NAD(P)-dependent oxidoreductase [Acidimicrobiales bacterium]